MKRRELLASAGSALAFAGCSGNSSNSGDAGTTATTTSTTTTTETPDNPWGKLPITVGLSREVSAAQNANEKIQQSLRFWETNAGTYTGHEIEYSYEPNNDDADIIVRIVNHISGCPQHTGERQTVGCAPIIHNNAPEQAEIQVLGSIEGQHLLIILKHEFGHTLGLSHQDEPQEVMSNDPSLRIPDYEDRNKIVDKYHEGINFWDESLSTSSSASDAYQDERFEDAKPLYSEAANLANDSADSFGDAETIAIGLDEQKVADICAEARQKSLKFSQAKIQMERACEDFANGDYDPGNEHVDKQQEYHEEMRNLQIRHSSIIIDELGL